eukprot:1152782-Pelagomonas_calceolata.AAC.1
MPPMEDARFVMIWTTSIILSSDIQTQQGMHTNRHQVGLSLYVEALSKGRFGSSLIGKKERSAHKRSLIAL